MNKQRLLSRRRDRGFSLIEVLVAIVVLAIGVLGVAALQSKSMSQGQGSLQATQAMALAYDYADRIRANPCGAYQGLYEITTSSPPSSAPSKTCTSASASCASTDLAAYDRYDWYVKQVKTKLPVGSTAQVLCADGSSCSKSNYSVCGATPNPPQTITITVFWTEKGTGNDRSTSNLTGYNCGTSSYDPTVDLPCVTLSVQP